MTAEQERKRAYLNRAYYLAKRINLLEDKKNDMKFSGRVKHGYDDFYSGGYNREEIRIMQILKADEKMKKEIEKLKITLDEITDAINSVEDIELGNILICRYIKCMSMTDIARELGCDISSAKRKHKKALDSFEMKE